MPGREAFRSLAMSKSRIWAIKSIFSSSSRLQRSAQTMQMEGDDHSRSQVKVTVLCRVPKRSSGRTFGYILWSRSVTRRSYSADTIYGYELFYG